MLKENNRVIYSEQRIIVSLCILEIKQKSKSRVYYNFRLTKRDILKKTSMSNILVLTRPAAQNRNK